MQSSDQSSENVEDSLERLKIHEHEDETQDSTQPSRYPDRPGEPDCLYYLRTGSCGYGSNCRFNHPVSAAQRFCLQADLLSSRDEFPERIGQPNCEYFLKTGTCKYGASCKYHHPRDRNGALPILFNILGLPMRQDRKACSYYMRTGTCQFGITCKFHHPQPTSPVPLNGTPSVYGGFPAWSVPRFSYMNGPSLQGLSGYIPFVVSPSHGILSIPGFDTFTSSSLTDMVGSMNQFDNLPERPDQPECRYYMNSGTCKYGADCKFHHPKERIAHIASSSPSSAMNSLTLPSRPGRSVCASYIIHGVCKFGSGCRFDHPLPQYPSASTLDLSAYATYPRLSPTMVNPLVKTQTLPSRDSDRTKNVKPSGEDGSLETKKPMGMSERACSDQNE